MLPIVENDDLTQDFDEELEPSKNFYVRSNGTRVYGTIDGVESLKQSILIYLSIERYKYEIYDWSVGFETYDLFGKPPEYVASEVPRRIHEAIIEDDRILNTRDFEVTINRDSVSVKYVVETIYGEINLEREVQF